MNLDAFDLFDDIAPETPATPEQKRAAEAAEAFLALKHGDTFRVGTWQGEVRGPHDSVRLYAIRAGTKGRKLYEVLREDTEATVWQVVAGASSERIAQITRGAFARD